MTKGRICLKCHKEFNSTGIGNRICYKCAEDNDKVRLSTREPSTGSGNRKSVGVRKE